jgi:hypothetical protein
MAVKFVRLALKVVVLNGWDFMDIILLDTKDILNTLAISNADQIFLLSILFRFIVTKSQGRVTQILSLQI